MSSAILPMPSVYEIDNTNNLYYVLGPVVDGLSVVNGVLVPDPTYVTDLAITLSLYQNRDLFNPVAFPGTPVNSFGSAGSLTMTYTGTRGIYRANIVSFQTGPGGNYVLVIDAPPSGSGYQLHLEKTVIILTRQN